MAIHWYPGHMHKARKQIEEVLPKVDLIIEVLDARIPYSSENPMITSLREHNGKVRPCIKLLNKNDLADPVITQQWRDYLQKEHGVTAMPLSCEQPSQVLQITRLCRELFPGREHSNKPIHAMIMGIPNVGKSTLINILADRAIAKVGNEPAITKRQQRINLDNGIVLSDTPGMLWPKIENENSSYRLAVTGAVKDTAMEYEDVAFFAVEYLLQAYPERLQARYQLDELPDDPETLLERIGKKRGCLGAGGRVNLNKVGTLLLNEIRAGMLGRISLETPEMIEREKKQLVAMQASKAEKKAARKKAFKSGNRQAPGKT